MFRKRIHQGNMSSDTTNGEKKLPTLKKHILSKHMEQKCKIYGKMFETSMKIVSYVAIKHNTEDTI